jgi:hypothetical protein
LVALRCAAGEPGDDGGSTVRGRRPSERLVERAEQDIAGARALLGHQVPFVTRMRKLNVPTQPPGPCF